MGRMGKDVFALAVVLMALGLDLAQAQGYYGGDDGAQPQAPSGPAISSLPQYESSPGTNADNYWWLNENPFQKPKNHPGVEKSDPAQPYFGQSKPVNPGQKTPPLSSKQPQKEAAPKEFKYRPITTPYNSGQNDLNEENPCMLRVKSDCHAGSSPSFNFNQSPPANQQQQLYYSGASNSFTDTQQPVSQNQPQSNPDTPYVAIPPSPPNPHSNNQYYNSGPTDSPQFANSQQSYKPQQQQYNPSYNQQSQQSGRPYQAPQSNGYESNQNYEEQPPYPGCPAAMLCVPDDWCNTTGFSEGKPLSLTPAAKAFRVAVMACTNVENNEVGICCRDPDYVDPWPAGGDAGQHQHHETPASPQPQQPAQQYTAGQSYRPQSPPQTQQQKPSYSGQSYQQQQQPTGQSYQPQSPPQTQQQKPSYSGQSYQQPSPPQPQAPQQPPYSGQSYQPQSPPQPQASQQKPYSGQSYQSQSPPQAPQQPSYSGQSFQQQPQKPQQTPYSSAAQTYQQAQPNTGKASSFEGKNHEQTSFHVCDSLEECVESFSCHQEFRTTSDNRRAKKCKADYRGNKYICCQKPAQLAASSSSQTIHLPIETIAIGEIPSSSSESKQTFTNKELPETPMLIHGQEFSDKLPADIIWNENPYQNQTPIYFISPSTAIIPSTPWREEEATIMTSVNYDKEVYPDMETNEKSKHKLNEQLIKDKFPIPIPEQNYKPPPLISQQFSELNATINPTNSAKSNSEEQVPFLSQDYEPPRILADSNISPSSPSELRNLPIQRDDESEYNWNGNEEHTVIDQIPIRIPSQSHQPPLITKNKGQLPESNIATDFSGVELQQQPISIPVQVPSQFHEPPGFTGQAESDYLLTEQNGNQRPAPINIPSQFHEPHPFFSNTEKASNIHNPDLPTTNLTEFSNKPDTITGVNGTNYVELLGIRGSFPTRKRFVDECPKGMKCLRESYCQAINPNEGSIDQFDIRVGASGPARTKCRQANLPVDGVCCFLKEDYASMVTLNPLIPDLDPVQTKVVPEDSCGVKRPNVKRASNQSESASFGEFPWQVLLQIGNRQCGGAIVGRRTVLTSATCLRNVKPDEVVIRVGEWEQGSESESKKHQDVKASSILLHPKYLQATMSYNLALLVAQSEFKFDYHIGRVCLPQPVNTFEGTKCISTGWGSANTEKRTKETYLRQTEVRILPKSTCEQKLKRTSVGTNFRLSQTSLCASVEAKDVSTCSADEGGPLMCENSSTGEYVLAGILINVMRDAACNSQTPLIFTNIPQNVEWIDSNIK